jgi:hypothetical protein
MRILIALAALLFLTTFAPLSRISVAGPAPAPAARPTGAMLAFEPVPLIHQQPSTRRVGALLYLEGWTIRSGDGRLGGISSMHIEGQSVLAVSDTGLAFRFAVPMKGRTSPYRVEAIGAGPGGGTEKGQRDAESMAVQGGSAWIGYEGRNAIWRYPLNDWQAGTGTTPRAMRNWLANEGSEAMLRLKDGRFLVFSEGGARGDGTTEVLLFDRDPADPSAKTLSLGYRAPAGYKITDAAWLPDGRVLLLNRRFALMEGISAKLVAARLPALERGGRIEGEEVATLQPPITVDNMEALSVTAEGGRTIVWIASDDNFSPLQRTLLMKFELGS